MTRNEKSTGLFYEGELCEFSRRSGEYARRRKDVETQRVVPGDVDYWKSKGWVIDKVLKRTVRMRIAKPPGRVFEDEVWVAMFELGFTKLNARYDFRIRQYPCTDESPSHQVDVFACDDSHAFVVECKSSTEGDKRHSLKKDINEILGLSDGIRKAVRAALGKHMHVAFVLALKNVRVSEADLKWARNAGVSVLTWDELNSYLDLARLIGPAAKYPFLGRVLPAAKIPGPRKLVSAVRGKMGTKTFYLFAVQPAELLKRAFVARRAKASELTQAYQRVLSKNRLKKISKFISGKGIFPSNIIVNFTGKKPPDFQQSRTKESQSDAVHGALILPHRYCSAWVIDGQHRLYGFSGSPWAEKETVPVIAFHGLPISEQGKMFIDINKEQVPVTGNLLWDLYEDLYSDSTVLAEQVRACISAVAHRLNSALDSPLRGHLRTEKDFGQKTRRDITFQTVCSAIDKNRLIGRIYRGSFEPGPLFRGSFVGAVDVGTRRIVSFLSLFAGRFERVWMRGKGSGGYFRSNNGISALFILLHVILEYLVGKSKRELIHTGSDRAFSAELSEILSPVFEGFEKFDTRKFDQFRKRRGIAGMRQCAREMAQWIANVYGDFRPAILKDFPGIPHPTDKQNEAAKLLMECENRLRTYVVGRLKKEAPRLDKQDWTELVPTEIFLKAVKEQRKTAEESKERHPIEKYFYCLDLKKIIFDNWREIFTDTFRVERTDNKEKNLRWLDRLCRIRNLVFHVRREVTDDELDFVITWHGWISRL